MLLIGVIVLSFIAWLLWSAIKYSPTDEVDIMKSILASEMFGISEILIASRPSDCRTQGSVRGSIEAGLYEAYLKANATTAGSIDLYRYRPRQRYVDSSKEPIQWYRELGKPVASISRAGIEKDRALVCVDIFADHEQSYLVILRHSGSRVWLVESEVLIWEEERELPPEEFPESNIPEIR